VERLGKEGEIGACDGGRRSKGMKSRGGSTRRWCDRAAKIGAALRQDSFSLAPGQVGKKS